ncbi:hypothetical protein ACFCWB_11470 [Streptomyces bacillaris]|uniref:hypothetical protein n=1 Tax=Streptomyces bacillaris TaxID=68179 RepID=UPI0035E14FD3
MLASRRLVAIWAAHLPQRARDGQWVPVIEALLKDTIDLGHASYRAYRSEYRRARAERRPPPELTGVLAREWAARLPEHDVIGLLRELVMSVHPADGTAFRWARPVRHALAGLLCHDIEACGGEPWSAYTDLTTVRVVDATFFLGPVLETGPLLARAVLDLAAADAAAGVPLTERMRAWPKIAETDAALHDRVLAAHLAAHPPRPTEGAGVETVEEWWDLAMETVVRLLANPPTPEGARLAALCWTPARPRTPPASGSRRGRRSARHRPPKHSDGCCRSTPTRRSSALPRPARPTRPPPTRTAWARRR